MLVFYHNIAVDISFTTILDVMSVFCLGPDGDKVLAHLANVFVMAGAEVVLAGAKWSAIPQNNVT